MELVVGQKYQFDLRPYLLNHEKKVCSGTYTVRDVLSSGRFRLDGVLGIYDARDYNIALVVPPFPVPVVGSKYMIQKANPKATLKPGQYTISFVKEEKTFGVKEKGGGWCVGYYSFTPVVDYGTSANFSVKTIDVDIEVTAVVDKGQFRLRKEGTIVDEDKDVCQERVVQVVVVADSVIIFQGMVMATTTENARDKAILDNSEKLKQAKKYKVLTKPF